MEAFVTVFFGILDCTDGTLLYANGGHTAGAIRRAGGPASLQVTGPLLGAFGNAAYRDAWARLDRGDLLFLYTDGLTEARHAGDMFGESRLFDAIARAEGTTPTEMMSEVIGEVVAFAGGRLNDDMAVLAVQLTGRRPDGAQQQRLEV
jgi:sigma-B regulation protein RsbU (phosphoserine phosphatase)